MKEAREQGHDLGITETDSRTSDVRFGRLPPRYNFVLNPYPLRVARCPVCEGRSGQRKLPLLVHVDPHHLVALNYTCRFCRNCDLLIAHKLEVEGYLRDIFAQREPAAIGNEYLVIGTVEKRAWRESLTRHKTPAETFPFVHDFKRHCGELRMTRGGWCPRDQEPPVWEPPKSDVWVKAGRPTATR